MPYRIDTYTDENVFSNTYGDSYTQTVWDSSCGESSDIGGSFSVTADNGYVWELYTQNITFTYPIVMYVDGVECTSFTSTGTRQTVEFKVYGGVITMTDVDDNSKLYFKCSTSTYPYLDVEINSLNLSCNTFVSRVSSGSLFFSHNNNNRVLTANNICTDNLTKLFIGQTELTYADISLSTEVRRSYWAFCGCSSLETVVMPSTMNRLTELWMTFNSCPSLKNITLPSSLPLVEAFYSTFYGCTKLESVVMPTTTPFVTQVQSAFNGCTNLKTLDLSCWDTTNLSQTFSYYICKDCINLTDLNIDGWNFTSLGSLADRLAIATSDNGAKLERLRGNISGLNSDEDWRYYTYLDRESVMVLINGLETVSKTTTLTLFYGVYSLLSDDDIAVATDKGWTVASARI